MVVVGEFTTCHRRDRAADRPGHRRPRRPRRRPLPALALRPPRPLAGRGRPRRLPASSAAPVLLSGHADLRRLHQARRHRHLVRADRPGDGTRPQPRRPRTLQLPRDARIQPRRRLPDRRLHPLRHRAEAGRRRPRLGLPALPLLPRGDALAGRSGRSSAGCSRRAGLRALAVFVAAQPALLFGYALWGGVKEVGAAALVALAAALAPAAVRPGASRPRRRRRSRSAAAALVGVLSLGGLVWLGAAAARRASSLAWSPLRSARRRCGWPCAFAVLPVRLRHPRAGRTACCRHLRAAHRPARRTATCARRSTPCRCSASGPPATSASIPNATVVTAVLIALAIFAALVGLWARLAPPQRCLAALRDQPARRCCDRPHRLPLGGRQGARHRLAGRPLPGDRRRHRRRCASTASPAAVLVVRHRRRRALVQRARLRRRQPRPLRAAARAAADRR